MHFENVKFMRSYLESYNKALSGLSKSPFFNTEFIRLKKGTVFPTHKGRLNLLIHEKFIRKNKQT